MKHLFSIFTLLVICSVKTFAQTEWQASNHVSQYWPNNDIKSYGNKLYVASNDGLFSSSDNGSSWTKLTEGVTGMGDLVEIQFTNNGGIFVRQNSFGIVSSLDGGTTWKLDTAGVGGNYGAALLYYDSNSDKVFFGVGYSAYALYYKSPTDNSWTKVSNLPQGLNNFSPVQMTRVGNKLILIDIYTRVLESTDDGISWTQKNSAGLVTAESQVGPSRFLSIGNDLFYGIGGVFKSSDEGATWTKIDQGFASSDTRCLYYDGTTLYASTYSQRKTYKSTDKGVTWTEFGGTGDWFFKAFAKHNGALYGVVHAKDSIYIYGNLSSVSDINRKDSKITIYPNPSTNYITIDNLAEGSLIKIIDINGKTMYKNDVIGKVTVLDTENFENGIYLLQINYKGIISSEKFIVNK